MKLKWSLIFLSFFTLSLSAGARTKLEGKLKENVVKVLSVNESLHNHFFNYNAALVEEDAKRLINEIKKIENKEIKKILEKTTSELERIKASSKREDNNISYHKASLGLVELIEAYDAGKKYNSYSCPMVKKKWVQNTQTKRRVHNPYAPEMPHCGQRDTDY